MNYVDVQNVSNSANLPDSDRIQIWIDAALADYPQDSEIVVRIVDEEESGQLNSQYRHKTGPTNILSFPAELPEGVDLDLLGDLVVCAPVLEREALEQGKKLDDHWAHIVVHGVLHLLGYDHIEDDESAVMEDKEIEILRVLNIRNPYLETNPS